MKENIKEIRIGKGLGSLTFGNTREQVKAILGDPGEVERYSLSEFEEDETEAWHYDDLGLSLSFDQDNDWRLSSLAISSEEYTLEGSPLIGRNKEEILAEFKERSWGTTVEDEEVAREDPGNSLIHVDEASMSLWFEDGELTELQIGPFYKNDEVVWP
ncbi:MAG: hypothetical protein EOP49_16600 [Sphingobacteriales bacterium]|nr:MAG: hypothetical protein EOP49_16600 [Sphingobacteriales bacterium]